MSSTLFKEPATVSFRPVPRDFHQVHSRSPSLQIKCAQGARRQVRSTCPAASRPARDAPRPRSLPQHAAAPHTCIRTPVCPCTHPHVASIARGSHIHPALHHIHIASPSALFRRARCAHIMSHTHPRTHILALSTAAAALAHCLLLRFAGRAVDFTVDGSTEPRPSQRHRGSAGNLQTSLHPRDYDDGDGYGDVYVLKTHRCEGGGHL